MTITLEEPEGGQLASNIINFARVLRKVGLPVGPGKVLDAISALLTVGITNREDFYWSLHAVFVNRRDQRELFDQAFHVFWRNPRILEKMLELVLPEMNNPLPPEQQQTLSRRISDALNRDSDKMQQQQNIEKELDARLSWSNREVLQHKDFEQMSAQELDQAKRMLRELRLNHEQIATRRFRRHPQGERIDLRATLRQGLQSGTGIIALRKKKRRKHSPPLVLLCDISGSMTHYSRMLLHFAHALSNDHDRVYTFVFGTRLSNISRQLRYKDVDEALQKVSDSVEDWSGGTCIGRCLHQFNRDWSRRVLGQGATVLFISDGLDRETPQLLGTEMERLHKSCRRLIWLNPLLRYDGFEAKAQGVRAILPHVDVFRSAHNIESLAELGELLNHSTLR